MVECGEKEVVSAGGGLPTEGLHVHLSVFEKYSGNVLLPLAHDLQ